MKTRPTINIHDKAKKYAKKIIVPENRDSFSNEANLRTAEYWVYKAYLAGYNEAMRWRDPKEEFPNDGEEVQLKIFDTYYNKQEYKHDVYLGGRWRFWESKYIDILGWRPIK